MSFESINDKKKNIEVITDPKRIRALIDENRLEILRALREGVREEDGTIRFELTIPEIASKLGKKSPNLYHHADVLVESGFLEIARQEAKKRSSITYYKRTKPVFIITYDPEREMPRDVYDIPLIAALSRSFGLDENSKLELHNRLREYRHKYNQALQQVTNNFEKHQVIPLPQEHVFEAVTTIAQVYLLLDEEIKSIAKDILKIIHF